jgi:shikimate dehydrogenase
VDRYAVIGCPVGHSKSPRIHSAFAEQTGQRLSYTAIEVKANGVETFLRDFAAQSGRGANVTVPLKEEAFRTAAERSPRATRAMAVNTLWLDQDGLWHGDNTDGAGLVVDLTKNHDFIIRDRRVLILGAGGATRGILEPILAQRPASVVVANRTVSRALELVRHFTDAGPVEACGFLELSGEDFDLVINATSASLQGELLPLPDGLFKPGACAYDLMYGDAAAGFLSWCRKRGAAEALDGLGMLVEQAAESFFIWRGVRPETAPVIAALS